MTTGGMDTPGITGAVDSTTCGSVSGDGAVCSSSRRSRDAQESMVSWSLRGGGGQQRGDQAQLAGEAGPALEVLVGPVDPGVRVGLQHRVDRLR